jgi:hypothetical protein
LSIQDFIPPRRDFFCPTAGFSPTPCSPIAQSRVKKQKKIGINCRNLLKNKVFRKKAKKKPQNVLQRVFLKTIIGLTSNDGNGNETSDEKKTGTSPSGGSLIEESGDVLE